MISDKVYQTLGRIEVESQRPYMDQLDNDSIDVMGLFHGEHAFTLALAKYSVVCDEAKAGSFHVVPHVCYA